MSHTIKMIVFTIMSVIALSGFAAQAVPALAAPVQSAHTRTGAVQDTARRCTSHYAYSNGYTGALGNVPFAKAKWLDNACVTHLEVRVNYTTHQTPPQTGFTPHSGSVKAVGLWSEAAAPAGDKYNYSQIRFKCDSSACTWGAWQKLPNTGAALPGNGIHLTAFSRSPVPPAPLGVSRRCTATYGWNISPADQTPATLSEWWTANSCGYFESPAFRDVGGAAHFGDHWRTAVYVNSLATGPNAMAKGWLRYKPTSGGNISCLRVFPTRGTSWFGCNTLPS